MDLFVLILLVEILLACIRTQYMKIYIISYISIGFKLLFVYRINIYEAMSYDKTIFSSNIGDSKQNKNSKDKKRKMDRR